MSAAQYCARKLPEDFCVIAVDNGRIVFKREAIQTNPGNFHGAIVAVYCNLVYKPIMHLFWKNERKWRGSLLSYKDMPSCLFILPNYFRLPFLVLQID